MSNIFANFGVPGVIGGIISVILFSLNIRGDKNIFGAKPLPWIGVFITGGTLIGMLFLFSGN